MSIVVRTHSGHILALALALGALLLLLFALPLAGDEPAKDKDPDQAAMQGKWKLKWLETDGTKRDPTDEEKGKELVVTGNQMAFGETKFSFTVTSKTDPKLFDVTLKADDKELLFEGIYKLEKDELTLCVFLDEGCEKRRPTKFETKQGSMIVLVAFGRAE
jgi:uncharacterized protein (TIGR03067 family)